MHRLSNHPPAKKVSLSPSITLFQGHIDGQVPQERRASQDMK